jgi:hypothetical protein
MLDFTKLGGNNPVDSSFVPREIFQALPKSSGKFQYPRDVQSQIWTKWYEKRDSNNLVIKMNTGGGKTIVGLLILKSCLNEKKGPAVYVVPDNYLIAQVQAEAKDIGIETTTNTEDPRYLSGKSILIVNIHKLVNGRSVFGVGDEGVKLKIGSVIIDDAHACLDTVEQQFTMTIPAECQLYNDLKHLFSDALKSQSEAKFYEIEDGDASAYIQVPFWSWQNNVSRVTEILAKNKRDKNIEFSYPLIKDNITLANCVFSSRKIEISPHYIPIEVIPSLKMAYRQVFMTATLADDSILSTHFGVNPAYIDEPITPESAGDVGDRMILLPQVINPSITDDEIKSLCARVSKKHNVVVIVPSTHRRNYWSDVADLTIEKDNIIESVEKLKRSHVGLTILTNRYDGIDLPQTACRLLVIDGLPDARNLMDRVRQSALMSTSYDNIDKIQRIEQGMGRGIRSNDDYCVVMLVGKRLTSTIYNENACDYFSPATKAQMELSEQISEQVKGKTSYDIEQLMNYCLNQDQQWVIASKGKLASLKYASKSTNVLNESLVLYSAFTLAKQGNQIKSCETIEKLANECKVPAMQGYLKQVLAEYTNLHDVSAAQRILLSANALNQRLLKPISGHDYKKINEIAHGQAEQCFKYLNDQFVIPSRMLIHFNAVYEDLNFSPNSSNRFESAIDTLGKMLGFICQRPEVDYKKGPDNLWSMGNSQYLVIECKNEATNETISKSYCNQLNGSSEWFLSQYDYSCKHTPILIHPSTEFEYASSPKPEIRIINKQNLDSLKNNAKSFFESLASNSEMNNVIAIRDKLTAYSLRSQDIVEKYTTKYRIK